MKKDSTSYTFGFALAVCVICSLALAAVSEGLRSRKELNEALDVKKNILKAVRLQDPLPPHVDAERILNVYDRKIEELVINSSGDVVEEKTPLDIAEGEALYPLYVYKEDGKVKAYAFPIVGKGLWSTLYGYFALEPDATTVRGITFYKHGETPGLGAEIEADWFQGNFRGKKIWDAEDQALKPVQVIKGKVEDAVPPDEQQFYVDGISGATMTSKGVSRMLKKELNKYEPFLGKVRSS